MPATNPPGLTARESWWEHSPTGQLVVDAQGLIYACNTQLAEWMGQPASELIGHPASTLLDPASRAVYLGLFAFRMATMGRVDEVHLVLRSSRHEDIPVLCCAVRLIVDDERLTQISLLPIKRKNRLESELIHARQAAEKAAEERAQALAELEQAMQKLNDVKDH
ncbi:PAS domain-containing protein [Halomonas sp. hl-4]|uniref:PAS domain-containing protein n=1 Tax=Halomonas sp. hl-4 TaxID=1761789 RepID=UPI000BB7A185|nr:PAS domain-containing protein [Halomonas sp. hl-4]SNY98204.1 PAS domain S-box-containing protein [Halomonas sp. hl-4]